MFTFCPGCHRQFRIFAEQIAAASGEVRCGFCDFQFNVLEQLYDEPLTPDELQQVIDELSFRAKHVEEEPQFVIPSEKPEIKDVQETVIVADNVSAESELQRSIQEIGVDEESVKSIDTEPNELESVPETELIPETTDKNSSEKKFTFEPEPVDEDFLLDESGTRSGMRWFWSATTFLAIVVLLAQLAWFQRDWLLQQYPQAIPYAKQICDKFECSLIRQKNTLDITLLNRDVRLHPSYADTLLVNATMKNELASPQPYPKVQLTLFDTNGDLVAYRVFVPTEYLDNSIDIEQGMPVNSPVHFVLEVAGSSSEAVSFEFRFL